MTTRLSIKSLALTQASGVRISGSELSTHSVLAKLVRRLPLKQENMVVRLHRTEPCRRHLAAGNVYDHGVLANRKGSALSTRRVWVRLPRTLPRPEQGERP